MPFAMRDSAAGSVAGMVDLPLVGQPEGQLADGNQRQIDQQLRDVALRIDVVPAAGAGQAGKDSCRSSATRIADEQAVLPIEHERFISRSLTLLSIGTAPSVEKTFSSRHWLKA